ncbi:hypothetical protein ZYGR_0W00460 [Zygosaccharomyces rouxii]|uniref:Vacuolar protein sorting-associated protein VTA1 n=1 Tax=Zygosaccharomyces rouxii TaxID=4956 RepID=A0A1Q3A4L6_ZYGRO|nr:hypothetical protein ZYGR_0W00460 [Zygosaccharomyces rouxii]
MSSTVGRLVATAGDMDVSGLAAIGYYLRLYAVELILDESRDQRSEEQTQLATKLLNQVEEYKTAVDTSKDEDQGAFTILHDQDKAKTYVLNFTMSLYNEKLKQLKDGNWDASLRRGLWCCLDLFQCMSKLWGMQNELKDRIKYCKIYLRKIAREKPPVPQVDDKELDEMLEKLNTESKEENSPPAFIDESEERGSEGPTVEDSEPEPNPAPAPAPEPKIPEPNMPEPEKATEPSHKESIPLTPSRPAPDFKTMMDRSSLFGQIQKKAKYVISALDYEDVSTARQELTSALSLLQQLEEQ